MFIDKKRSLINCYRYWNYINNVIQSIVMRRLKIKNKIR